MPQPRPLVWIALACTLLTGWAAGADPIVPAVRSQVALEGVARVIVELADPAFDAGLRRRASTALDPRRLARTRDRLERRLPVRARRAMRRFAELPILAMAADPADLAVLESAPEVVAVYLDRLHAPTLSSSVPHQGIDLVTDASFDGLEFAVAIIDTGVDASHPTFSGRVVAEACYSLGGDCPGGATSLVGTGAGTNCSFSEDCFHGTHVAGIAAGANSTYTGVAPLADIVAVNVFSKFNGALCLGGSNPCALAYTSDIIAGLVFARSLTTVSVAATNLSLGGGQYTSRAACDADDPPMAAEIAAVRAAGIAPVASSGNEYFTNAMGSPACHTGAISVGATSDADVVASFSNSASFLSLLATGVSVASAVPPALFGGTTFLTFSGTSMAAPHVAGSFAALRSALPAATVDEMLLALQSTGVLVTDSKSGVTTPRIQLDLASKSLAPAECWNGLDDDGEGDIDFPADPGCLNGYWIEAPECQDGIDNDGDGGIDYAGGPLGEPADPQCSIPGKLREAAVSLSCGLGPELALVLPLIAALRRRR